PPVPPRRASDLPQPRNPTVASLRQPHLARRDPSTPRGQELADLCPVVHRSSSVRRCCTGRRSSSVRRTRRVVLRSLLRLGLVPVREGVPPGTPIIRLSHADDHPRTMERGGWCVPRTAAEAASAATNPGEEKTDARCCDACSR